MKLIYHLHSNLVYLVLVHPQLGYVRYRNQKKSSSVNSNHCN